MVQVIAIFGAGSGLGAAVARRFGQEGYVVALLGRRLAPLEALRDELAQAGTKAAAFCLDLADVASVPKAIEEIHQSLGAISVVYYGPATAEAFMPATDVSVTALRPIMDVALFSFLEVVQQVLHPMIDRRSGAIISAVGGDLSKGGYPYMSGFSIGHAAVRNFLHSLRGEVQNAGVSVGLVGISGVIKGSEYYHELQADMSSRKLEMPIIEPDEIAEALWKITLGDGSTEILFPAQA